MQKSASLKVVINATKNRDLTPYDVTIGSNKKVWWNCDKERDHIWETKLNNRVKSGCPFCVGQKASISYNLVTVNSERIITAINTCYYLP